MVDADNKWMARSEIATVEGALKASAYVARAYNYVKEHDGALPPWAGKLPNGRWVFDHAYIAADARRNRGTINISEAARLLGATRRAVQTWIDEGIIPVTEGGHRSKGETRRIPRTPFMRALPRLRKRLETPAVVGYRKKHGQEVPEEVVRQIEAEREKKRRDRHRRAATREQERRLRDETRLQTKLEEQLATLRESEKELSARRREAEREAERKRVIEEHAIAAEREFRRKLREAERTARRAGRERRNAARKAADEARGEDRTRSAARKLAEGLESLVRAAKRRKAEAVEEQLRAARRGHQADADAHGTTAEAERTRKAKSAAAAEAKFRAARQERYAEAMADRITNDMYDDRISRAEALTLFCEIAVREELPPELVARVHKRFFGP